MKIPVREIVTPLAAVLFLVSCITGTALFFHWSPSVFKTTHEWLGMVFIAGGLWHAIRHWNSLVGYFSRPASQAVLSVSAIAAVVLTVATAAPPNQGGPRAVFKALEKAPIESVAPALGLTLDQANAKLSAKGIQAEQGRPLGQIAREAKMETGALLSVLAAN